MSKGEQRKYDPRTFKALTYHDATPGFRSGADTPRAYLERSLETIAAREPVVKALRASHPRWLPGYQIKVLDGNHLSSTEHRLKALRGTWAAPLPGQALVVLDQQRMLITDVFLNDPSAAAPPPPVPTVHCKVPRVIGLRLATARKRIGRAHCRVGRVRRARSGRVGRVLSQSPKAGTVRARGTRVKLVVGRR